MLRSKSANTAALERRLEDDGNTCPPCVCNATPPATEVLELKFLVPELGYANFKTMLDQVAENYRRVVGRNVEILVTGVDNIPDLQKEIIFDVSQNKRQFDGYILNPVITGELAVNDGLFDLTEFVRNYKRNPNSWLDVLLFYREVLSSYDERILLVPFDGDVLSLFYRKDLLEEHNISVPKTWDEYTKVARYFDGMEVETVVNETSGETKNFTLSGSCIGRTLGCGGGYWAQLILSSMTQYQGFTTGSMLDTRNLDPLLAQAMQETLRILEEQAEVGTSDEFDGCVGTIISGMNRGECVLSYNWGNSFTEHINEGSVLNGRLGVAPTPGSHRVLNRTSGMLVECTPEMCPFAVRHEDENGQVQYVNFAPYAAYGGWSGAVSNNVSPENREAAADFLSFASDTGEAVRYVIPDQTTEVVPTGQDPYRKSLLDVDKWVSRGYPEDTTKDYLDTILSELSSENVVADIRFPQAAAILDELDLQTYLYLNDTINSNRIPPELREMARKDISDTIGRNWKRIINEYDTKESTTTPILEIYQRLRGVYSPPLDSDGNDSDSFSTGAIFGIVGFVVVAVIVSSITFAVCVIRAERKKREEDSWFIPAKDIVDTGEVLGRGSFGIVTKGFLRGTPVALKKPHVGPLDNFDIDADATLTTERTIQSAASASKSHPLQKELLTLMQLRHPHIVETLGATIIDEEMIVVLEYMEHNTIRKVLKDPNGVAGTAIMSVEIQWALQVAQGIMFLHSFPAPYGPLLHNDLKSSNVLVDASFNAHIADFGLASKTMKGMWGWINKNNDKPRGSVLWMAPEVLNGANPTPASDVYSFAMFLVELMTHSRPYNVKAIPNERGGDRRRGSTVSGVSISSIAFDKSSAASVENEQADLNASAQYFAFEEQTNQHEYPANEESLREKNNSSEADLSKRPRRRVSFSDDMQENSENCIQVLNDRRGSLRRGLKESTSPEGDGSESSKVEYSFMGTVNGKEYTREEIIDKIKDLTLLPPFRPDLPTDAPQVLCDLCIECWHKNPKRRPPMTEIEERLRAVVSNETVAQQLMRRGSMFDTILPREIQDKLARGEPIPPVPYEEATVIFSDIADFTNISSALSAEEVGDLIGRLFSKFDTLCQKHSVKKLDIIGDAFIGVAGVPTKVKDHSNKAAAFALDAIDAAKGTLVSTNKPHLGYIKVRFGIASGPVAATVLGGAEHPKYTLFGDTVNTASRMESTGEPSRCQCTEETAELIKANSTTLQVEERGLIQVKGKGMMRTFWVSM